VATPVRSTLFFVPHEILGWPLWGFGWGLAILLLSGVAWFVLQLRSGLSLKEILSAVWFWLIAIPIVTHVLPSIEQTWPDGTPIGLPVRGYGLMVLLGLLAGVAITSQRAKRLGVDPETIIGLGIWSMLGGVAGARIFFVVQKWDTFTGRGFERVIEIIKLTEGGLVIYGGIIGGLLAGAIFCYRHRLDLLSTADLIAPGFLIGLSFGRLGCLLHGCCFGAVCTADLPAIQFPQGSLPYQAQVDNGSLLGIDISGQRLPLVIQAVQAGSPADAAGIKAGDLLRGIYTRPVEPEVGSDPTAPPRIAVEVHLDKGRRWLTPEEMPPRSLETHPSQIYASINAALLSLLTWFLQPWVRRDGLVFFGGIFLYATSRFLLEWIRIDEAGQFGTSLTIAQWIAIASGLVSAIAVAILLLMPPNRAWQWQKP
jgi:phosphatidylglycerol---prolipoprotein diacylglyceryl transferase